MYQLQSIGTLLCLVLLCGAIAWWGWALAQDRADRAAGDSGQPMTGREAAARHLFGESNGWDHDGMVAFDLLPAVREPWLQEVDRRVALRRQRSTA